MGNQGGRILVVSPAFAAAQTAIDEDFVMTNAIPAAYLAAGRLTFETTGGTIYWSLAWGGAGYTGSNLGNTTNDADGNFGPAFAGALPSANTSALLFSTADPTGSALSVSNSTDYAVTAGAAVFTNNANQSGTVTGGTPQADLSITKSDGGVEGRWGQPLTYTLVASNGGPAAVNGATVTDNFPVGLSSVSWTCAASAGSACPASGTGNISASVDLLVAGTATFTATGTVDVGTAGPLVNTASVTVPGGVVDPDLGDNVATDTTPVGPIQFYTVAPCRVADTRGVAGPSGGPALLANSTRSFPAAGRCAIPADARAVAITLTVVQETERGNLRLFPAGSPLPNASNINFEAGHVRANNAVIGLGTAGEISVRCDMASNMGTTHFLFDVFGYFR